MKRFYELSRKEILGITAMSVAEYEAAKELIAPVREQIWLRDKGRDEIQGGSNPGYACTVHEASGFTGHGDWRLRLVPGIVDDWGAFARQTLGVRPALYVSVDPELPLSIGQDVFAFGERWTIVPIDPVEVYVPLYGRKMTADHLAVCDRVTGHSVFSRNGENDFEGSDLQNALNTWLEDRMREYPTQL